MVSILLSPSFRGEHAKVVGTVSELSKMLQPEVDSRAKQATGDGLASRRVDASLHSCSILVQSN